MQNLTENTVTPAVGTSKTLSGWWQNMGESSDTDLGDRKTVHCCLMLVMVVWFSVGEFGQIHQNSVNFTGISEPQDSVKGLTNILDIFAQFSD